jgi:hypothetical protein
MTTFASAAEVKATLTSAGVDFPVRVRCSRSPFGGRVLFLVSPVIPGGVSVVTSGGSREPTRFFSDDGGAVAGQFARIQAALPTRSNAYAASW